MSYIAPMIGEYKHHVSPNGIGTGWVLCNGQAISRTGYPLLFNLLNGLFPSLPFGNGNGSTTFNVPNFSGQIVGMPGTPPQDGINYTLGQVIGNSNASLQADNLPALGISGALNDNSVNVYDPGHLHSITNPYDNPPTTTWYRNGGELTGGGGQYLNMVASGGQNSPFDFVTNNATTGITASISDGAVNGSVDGTSGGSSGNNFSIMQPTLFGMYIYIYAGLLQS